MKIEFDNLLEKLKTKNIRLSHQRLKVLEYLTLNQCHPTVDQIYNSLHNEVPTLSKTTVYNTLNSLTDVGLVRVITIEDNETRYDIRTDNHGHFKCVSCKDIFDFDIDIDKFSTYELKDFHVKDKNVYFKGLCPKCVQFETLNK
ncbi:Fur family peroxide stress response transcriptional regulator [Sedimentibacter acidaminivorans]|uniref:Fur family peroxide stress response transcriptional regulator n=1 Tax=Sedimentibacter acidaminivorans TaxID=913099 RepID=A0ABS4GE62_9FIRM|nr:Fur family transcriptional regulator [Sedimentibacter acidaminivorans]MBP1925985.1 Fur family peroxide stress response transcriptional regulator [Sedimentibacter acidaminivorans]